MDVLVLANTSDSEDHDRRRTFGKECSSGLADGLVCRYYVIDEADVFSGDTFFCDECAFYVF